MTPADAPSTDRKTRSHERIVDAAARAIRLRGIAGVGVAEVMKEAGLTHGGFYAHFPSRDALLVAALERAGRASGDAIRRRVEASLARAAAARGASEPTAFAVLVNAYLHDNLLSAQDGGCPVAAVCSEMPRSTGDLRAASVERVRALVRSVARNLPEGVPEHEAGTIAGTLVGTLQLARTLGDTPEGRALLAATRENLIARVALNYRTD